MKIANRIIGKEPQINADERRYIPVTDFGAAHRKGRKERKVKRQESSHHLRPALRKYSLSELRTRMTRIRRIFTDTINPCASVSSVQSVFYGDCPHAAPNTKISGFIGVPPLLLGDRAKEECGIVANKEPQMNADERRCILTMDYVKTTHRKGRKERKAIQQEPLHSGVENRYSINSRVKRSNYLLPLLSERYVKVSLHTAQAFCNPLIRAADICHGRGFWFCYIFYFTPNTFC